MARAITVVTRNADVNGRSSYTRLRCCSKGLGYETARRLTELGHTVYVGARSAERGEAAAARLGVRFVPLDVTGRGRASQVATECR